MRHEWPIVLFGWLSIMLMQTAWSDHSMLLHYVGRLDGADAPFVTMDARFEMGMTSYPTKFQRPKPSSPNKDFYVYLYDLVIADAYLGPVEFRLYGGRDYQRLIATFAREKTDEGDLYLLRPFIEASGQYLLRARLLEASNHQIDMFFEQKLPLAQSKQHRRDYAILLSLGTCLLVLFSYVYFKQRKHSRGLSS
ncbi:MAG: hypothetical protein HYV97_07995 [Bdellovibrio sp.]|nr:hypothetical protein [Bdellovibrio sp.]